MLVLALAGCAPVAPDWSPGAVEYLPESQRPVRAPPELPCALPEGPDIPPVDVDDPEALFADGALPLIEVVFPPGAWAQACENAQLTADWMDARRQGGASPTFDRPLVLVDLVVEGRVLMDVGFRFRGQSNLYALFYDRWRRPIPGALEACKADRMHKKPSYRLDLDVFVPGRTLAGQQGLNLGGREGSDAAYLRESAAHHAAAQFGLPAPLSGHARVCRDGVYDGLFTFAEETDVRGVVSRLFPGEDHGDYWEIVNPASQRWESGWTATEGWQSTYASIEPTLPDHLGRLGGLLDAGDAIVAGEQPELDGLIDRDAWLRNIALDMVAPDYDGMMGNHKNHALYDHPTRGLLPISHDKDLAFVDLGYYLFGLCSGSIWGANPCWSSRDEPPTVAGHLLERYPEQYTALVEELLDGPLHPDVLLPWVRSRASEIRPWVYADRYYQPNGPACDFDPEFCQFYNPGAWEFEVSWLESNLRERREEVQRQLAGEFQCQRSCEDPLFVAAVPAP